MKYPLLISAFLLLFNVSSFSQTIRYVKPTGSGSGSSWTNASNDLQAMINASDSGDQIWVAAGTYVPIYRADSLTTMRIGDRDNAFVLKNGVQLYGGFAGTETDTSQRDWNNNQTILSGDFNQDDSISGSVFSLSFKYNSENAIHVLIASSVDSTTIIDGFSIQGGNANVGNIYLDEYYSISIDTNIILKNFGGGIYAIWASVRIRNCIISTSNSDIGGGVYGTSSSAAFINCEFMKNTAITGGGISTGRNSFTTFFHCTVSDNLVSDFGAGIQTYGASVLIINSTIKNNYSPLYTSVRGGAGMYNLNSSITAINCIISGNHSSSNGGGVYNYGSSSLFVNCNISYNTALTTDGGGTFEDFQSSAIYRNCIISNNIGGGVATSNSNPQFYNCVISGNTRDGLLNGYMSYSKLFNCTITNNGGAGINFTFAYGDSLKVYNSIISGNTGAGISSYNYNMDSNIVILKNNLIQGLGANANGNLDGSLYPLFKDAAHDFFDLQPCSPAINKGNNSLYPGALTDDKDMDGNPRLLDSIIDIGAYEFKKDSAFTIAPSAMGIVYVKKGMPGTKAGDSWSNATPELAEVLHAAASNIAIKQIWVAAGTYFPKYVAATSAYDCSDRNAAFVLLNNVKVYGGFSGTETAIDQRDLDANTTLLSGDFYVNDSISGSEKTLNISYNNENAYHVVIAAGVDTTSVLDGFVIQGGNANDSSAATVNTKSILRNCGGGIYNASSSAIITRCKINVNHADKGAGVYNNTSSSTFSSCLITKNYAVQGGSIYDNHSSPVFNSCTIVSNRATSGASLYQNGDSATFNNSIVLRNTTPITLDSSASIRRQYSLIQGMTGGSNGNLDSSVVPLFKDTINGDFSLRKCSPLINKGNNNLYYGALSTDKDLAGNPRSFDGNIDLGAYEYDHSILPSHADAAGIVYVKKGGAGTQSGNSWANAAAEVADVLKAAARDTSIKQVWVAAGIYHPLFTASTLDCGERNRFSSFVLLKNVALYGGFAGNETAINQRNWIINKSILSGDFNDDDYVTGTSVPNGGHTLIFNNNGENAIHVVIATETDSTTIMDGFTILGGNANSGATDSVNSIPVAGATGGGIYTAALSNLVISNCSIKQSTAYYGGGIYNMDSRPTFNNCEITQNTAYSGAGVYNSNQNTVTSNVIFNYCNLTTNYANNDGGGMTNYVSLPVLTHCIISGNEGFSYGGGMSNHASSPIHTQCSINNNYSYFGNGAGVWDGEASMPVYKECQINNNQAYNGGGIYSASYSSSTLANCEIKGNISITDGGGVYIEHSSFIFTNCIFDQNKSGNGSAGSNGGAIFNYSSSSTTLINCLIKNSYAGNGGGIYNDGSTLTLTNTTVTQNNSCATFTGGSVTIKNSILWGNGANISYSSVTPTIKNSLVQGMSGVSNGNLSDTTDPLFTNPSAEDFSLQFGSPVVNMGDNSLYGDSLTLSSDKDLAGNPRLYRTRIDMGAYENQTQGLSQSTNQVVNFTKVYGDSAFDPGVTATSGLPVNYRSSDTTMVKPYQDSVGWKLKIRKTGTVTITAFQPGNNIYDPTRDTTFTLTINKAPLTIKAHPQTKIYGYVEPIFYYTLTGLVNGDDSTIMTGNLDRDSGEYVGLFKINKNTLSPGNNYIVTYIGDTLTITKAPLIVTADPQSKIYGDTDPIFTYTVTGLVNGDFVNVITCRLTRDSGESVGSYAIKVDTLTAENYSFTYVGDSLTIASTLLTVIANPQSKVYGATDPVLTYTITGLMNGDDSTVVTGSLSRVSGENVGTYAINKNTIHTNKNYAFRYIGDNFIITEAPLEIKVNPQTKTYGDADPELTYTLSGLASWDDSTIITGTLSREVGENIGSYVIYQNTMDAGYNYTVHYTSDSLSITPALLNITAHSKTKVYGDIDPTLDYSVSGFTNGDDSTIISGNLSRNTGENVGSYTINQGSVAATNNYTINYSSDSLTITPASLDVTADPQTKVYGAVDPALTYVVNGLVNGDNIGIITGNLNRASGENVGTYIINQGSISAGNNYVMTYTADSLSITPASLTITANPQMKVRGDADPVLTYSINGLTNSDDSTVLTGNLVRDTGEAIGSYAIKQGTLSVGNNYSLVYVGDSLIITPSLGIANLLQAGSNGQIQVYPNPVNAGNKLNIVSSYSVTELKDAYLQLIDLSGKIVQHTATVESSMQITMPQATGIYLVNLVLANGQKTCVKILVKE